METWASLSLAHLLPEAARSSPFLQSTHGVGNGGAQGAKNHLSPDLPIPRTQNG